MEVRQLEISELDDLLNLYLHMHDFDEPMPERPVINSVWQEIHDNPYFQCFGLFVDSRLVSSCILSIVPNLSRGCRPYGVVENVVTHAGYRRKGYGRNLLKFMLQYAWEKKCYKVMLMTSRKNKATFNFYESVGFNREAKQAFLATSKNAVDIA